MPKGRQQRKHIPSETIKIDLAALCNTYIHTHTYMVITTP